MKKLFLTLIAFFSFLVVVTPAQALTFDLLAPTGELQSGQDVQFTINIDTEGASLTSSAIGMTYETQYIEYVSIAPGNTFTTVTTDNQGNGRLVITGSSTSGYSGTGSFAVITFKIVATSPGSTQLCALFNPGTTPTPPPNSTPTTVPPTALPTSGVFDKTARGAAMGVFFFALSLAGFIIFKKI